MNTSLPEMLHYLNTPENFNRGGGGGGGGGAAKMSVLERQQARNKWQQEQLQLQQLPIDYFGSDAQLNVFSVSAQSQHFQDLSNDQNLGGILTQAMKPDPGLADGIIHFGSIGRDNSSYGVRGYGNFTSFDVNNAVSRTASCPPAVAAAMAELATKGKETVLPEKLSSSSGRESFKKRKADKNHNPKVCTISSVNCVLS